MSIANRGVLIGASVATVVLVGTLVGQALGHDSGTTSHLWDHVKALREPGTINASSNPVHWTKLKGVPAGLADGNDAGVEGAGFGLNKAFGIFFINPGETQRRVTTACDAGRAVKSINSDGTAICTRVSQALSTGPKSTGIVCNNYCTEASLMLEPGTWSITAKIASFQRVADEDDIQESCRLHVLDITDEAHMWLRDDARFVTLQMQLVATVGAGQGAYLDCRDFDVGDLTAESVSIIAIRVGG